MTQTELRIKELLVELQARTDQMSVKVARVEGLERELAAAQKNSDLAQAETYGQFDRARRAEADRDRLREALTVYGQHCPECRSWVDELRMNEDLCTCGLMAVFKPQDAKQGIEVDK